MSDPIEPPDAFAWELTNLGYSTSRERHPQMRAEARAKLGGPGSQMVQELRKRVWELQRAKADVDVALAKLPSGSPPLVVVRCPKPTCGTLIGDVVGLDPEPLVYRATIRGSKFDRLERPLPWRVGQLLRDLPEPILQDDVEMLLVARALAVAAPLGPMGGDPLVSVPDVEWAVVIRPGPVLGEPAPCWARCHHHAGDRTPPKAWQAEARRLLAVAEEALRTGKRQTFRWARTCSRCATPLGTAPGPIACSRCRTEGND